MAHSISTVVDNMKLYNIMNNIDKA